MSFAQFMELALYHPQLGYYRAGRARVGYGPDRDFFTASTSGPLFGELVAAACVHLLENRPPGDFSFVEIGAESAEGILAGVDHPFGSNRVVKVGEPLAMTGQCVVFSNELFDAQPFRRLIFHRGAWHELGVQLLEGTLSEVVMPEVTDPVLPRFAPDGYIFDAPLAAAQLAGDIAAQSWSGPFVACDYGKSYRELTEEHPAGTARAYYRQRQSNDLLSQPGEQDLTCHVCWDWLEAALCRHGFAPPTLESQEAFFIRHAADFIAATSTREAAHFSQRKLGLLQLLHPSHLGQKFQVLHAHRP